MTEPIIIIDAIENVGFPIIAFLLMFWLTVTVIRTNTKAIQKLTTAIEFNSRLNPTIPPYQQVKDRYPKP